MRHQRQCALAEVVVAAALAGTQRRLAGELQRVTAAFAFGQVDPARQPRDLHFQRQRTHLPPVQQHVHAQRPLVLAYQQRVAACGVLPGNASLRVARPVGAQLVQFIATGMHAGVQGVAIALGQRRWLLLGRGVDQQRRVGPHP